MIVVLLIINFLSIFAYPQQCADPNCLLCTLPTVCNKCNQNYLLSNNSCAQCICKVANCYQCECGDPNYCISCHDNYQFHIQSGCRLKSSILVIILIGSLVVLIGFTISFRYVLNCWQRCLRYNQYRKSKLQLNQQVLNFAMQSSVETEVKHITVESKYIQQEETNFDYAESLDSCMICLQKQCNIITQCNHYFHSKCFENWLINHEVCPSCKSTNINLIKVIICMKCKDKVIKLQSENLNRLELARLKLCQHKLMG